ncbi:type II toxin-antitoxin system RelE/ParE family toxin [Spirosoma endophyticum]|uniref:Plasmid stabilization system protein ParE n=1 Tax=Spirosoma endophyticum TaxID=662367 RepID=A0A1I1QD10_9BACT|nr:type II toxin-antitoxin system RelE/ParE family toxin [Spirosoma endophyticum]SFD16000.1 Plasmid stabilization system protein ParE [Spirosoma endophyticum]
MDYTIAWSDEAKENYRLIALYLLDAFGFSVADKFTDTINSKLRILETMPFIGRRLDNLTAVRKLPLQPYNIIYYAVIERQVIVLNILDSRKIVVS